MRTSHFASASYTGQDRNGGHGYSPPVHSAYGGVLHVTSRDGDGTKLAVVAANKGGLQVEVTTGVWVNDAQRIETTVLLQLDEGERRRLQRAFVKPISTKTISPVYKYAESLPEDDPLRKQLIALIEEIDRQYA